MKTLIYGLVDPRTQMVRYVGKSSDGMLRPNTHRSPSVLRLYRETTRSIWIQELLGLGLDYTVVVLEFIPAPEARSNLCWWRASQNPTVINDAECWWIAFGRAAGWDLTNSTEGGEGVPGLVHTTEAKRQISDALLDRKFSDAHRAKISAAKLGKPKSEAHREAIRAARIRGFGVSKSALRKQRARERHLAEGFKP